MIFEWDENKRRINLQRHSIDFGDAELFFASEVVRTVDDRFDYGEIRYLTFGLLRGDVTAIVHTETDELIRIISFRKATRYEQTEYFRAIRN